MTAPSPSRRDATAVTWLTNLYFTYVGANMAVGALLAFAGGHVPPIALLLFMPVYWAFFGQVLTPVILVAVLDAGPRLVSHDVLPRDLVGSELVLVVVLLLVGSFPAWRSRPGRLLSYACVATLTLAAGIDLLGWGRQGL